MKRDMKGERAGKVDCFQDLKRQERLRFCRKRLKVQISMLGRVNTWYIRLEICWGKQKPEDGMRKS